MTPAIFIQLLGSSARNIERAAVQITQIYTNHGFFVKNNTLEIGEEKWRPQMTTEINNFFENHVLSAAEKVDKFAIITKCYGGGSGAGSDFSDEELTKLKLFIRKEGVNQIKPCAFYVVGKDDVLENDDKMDYLFEKYKGINCLFNVDKTLLEQEHYLDLFLM